MAKRLTRVGLMALMLALPVMVSASHQFSDVPTSHTFHAAIDRLYDARLTTGCTASKFCPNANVTRGQMAAFLNRGLGRGAIVSGGTGLADDWASLDGSGVASVDLAHGGGPGGTGFVLVTANISAFTTMATACPCELAVWLVNADTNEESAGSFQVITTTPAPADSDANVWYEGTASITYLFTVSSGVTNTYVLAAEIRPTNAPTGDVAGADMNMTAVYVPFGATGGNTQPAITTQSLDGGRNRH